MSQTSSVRFGIMTAPSQVEYDDVLQVWREADSIPQIEHAWLFDHLMPIFGDPNGPTFEGWTLLLQRQRFTPRSRRAVTPRVAARSAPRVAVPTPGRRRAV
jgi:hypothetical protein